MVEQFPENSQRKLPLPKWCYLLLAAPTFYMPLAYLTFVSFVLGSAIFDVNWKCPVWLSQFTQSALTVTLVLWPVYFLWALFSKQLVWREKLVWILAIFVGNMIAMPIFFVFMIRRYLGLEGKTNHNDEQAAEKLLAACGMTRTEINDGQWRVIAQYTRQYRQAKWAFIFAFFAGGLAIYFSGIVVPRWCMRIAPAIIPTHTVFIDSVKNTREDIAIAEETKLNAIKLVLTYGEMIGFFALSGVFLILLPLFQLWGNWHRTAFMNYLKATHDGERCALNTPH